MTAEQPQSDLAGGKTLIVGLGRTGLSCARFLNARGIPAMVVDSRRQPPGLMELQRQLPAMAVATGGFDPRLFAAAERLIVSPGVSLQEPLIRAARERGVEVLGDVELFAREARAPVVAITGSNGKSTVTTLVGEMARAAGLKTAGGGKRGPPVLELLDDEAALYVLELSSFQLESTRSLRPKAAVVLNLSPDHLDRYPGIEAYAAAKARVYRGAGKRVFNCDDPRVMAMHESDDASLFFTLRKPGEKEFGLRQREGAVWLCHGQQPLLPAARLRLSGRHNLANALAALALGSALELPVTSMLEALQRFRGLPHRTQFVAEHAGVRWYNDSKATNLGACIAALEGLASEDDSRRTVLIAGGEGKGQDFSPLAPVVGRTARAVVLIGHDAARIEAALEGRVPVVYASAMDDAVRQAAALAAPGDRVLLSPACASLDMFDDFTQRGEAFMAAVGRVCA